MQQALTLFCEYVPEYAVGKGIIEYDPLVFNAYYEDTQQNKEKRLLQAAIKAWNRAGNNIHFSTFYNVVMPDHDKKTSEKMYGLCLCAYLILLITLVCNAWQL